MHRDRHAERIETFDDIGRPGLLGRRPGFPDERGEPLE
jgi:hypothetical protein